MPPKKSSKSKSAQASSSGPAPSSRKRKAVSEEEAPAESESRPRKTLRTIRSDDEQPIIINRAPVLELWGACVASFLHPDLPWTACLSIGSSIATITAVSKGRAIGRISKPEPDSAKEKKRKKDVPMEGDQTVEVMGFHMTLRGDAVVVKGALRPGREASLARRFGDENLSRVKTAMEATLGSWEGHERQLDKVAFHLYEQFRPDIAPGQRGWGKKGKLSLSELDNVVRRQEERDSPVEANYKQGQSQS